MCGGSRIVWLALPWGTVAWLMMSPSLSWGCAWRGLKQKNGSPSRKKTRTHLAHLGHSFASMGTMKWEKWGAGALGAALLCPELCPCNSCQVHSCTMYDWAWHVPRISPVNLIWYFQPLSGNVEVKYSFFLFPPISRTMQTLQFTHPILDVLKFSLLWHLCRWPAGIWVLGQMAALPVLRTTLIEIAFRQLNCRLTKHASSSCGDALTTCIHPPDHTQRTGTPYITQSCIFHPSSPLQLLLAFTGRKIRQAINETKQELPLEKLLHIKAHPHPITRLPPNFQ